MKCYKYMSDLLPGEKGIVSDIYLKTAMKRRLQDLGMISGTVVECVGQSPLGDPAAYLIRGTVIALRSADAGWVKVKVVA